MKLFLNNREYEGHIYFLSYFRPEDAGTLMASCWGPTWGVGMGTCLSTLKDENGNKIVLPEYAGKEDYYKNGLFETLTDLNK